MVVKLPQQNDCSCGLPGNKALAGEVARPNFNTSGSIPKRVLHVIFAAQKHMLSYGVEEVSQTDPKFQQFMEVPGTPNRC